MVHVDFKNKRNWAIAGILAFFVLFSIWLRILPMLSMGNTDILLVVGSDDPLYNLRQVEQLLANNFSYAWFDPMSQFPVGTTVYWGPLFIYISGFACFIAGATTRPEIISVCLLVPVAMAAVTVILMYYIGKICGDYKTGILAAGFTAVVSGQFFYRSLYGYFDHHIGEVLFSTLFCLVYLYILLSEKDAKIDLKDFKSWRKTAFLSVFAGIAYLLGLFLMPTMIVFALIVVIFTVAQFIINSWHDRSSEYILVINSVTFAIAIIGLLLFGIKTMDLSLSMYSLGHIFAYASVIAGTVILYLISSSLKGKEKYYYPLSLAGLAIIFAGVIFVISPQYFNQLIDASYQFFGQAPVTNTVQEARGWSVASAWNTFNYGLILMFFGGLVCIYNIFREKRPQNLFIIIWAGIMCYSTWQHVRYEYYMAINVALLSAICVSFVIERGGRDLIALAGSSAKPDADSDEGTEESAGKGKKQKKSQKKITGGSGPRYLMAALVIVAAGIGLLFAYSSASYSYQNASGNALQMNTDWRESLDWMGNNTPDTGVDYYAIYNKNTFVYPNTSYGVMSWWDYGHMITYIAKRIPNANPFQAGVAGPDGAAAYFMATNESAANTILDHEGTRYIITDIEMDTGKFWAMATWYNSTEATAPYQETMIMTDSSGTSYQPVQLNKAAYYETMVSRLHNFDGSMTNATSAYYVVYADSDITHVAYPVITDAEAMNISEANAKAESYNLDAPSGYHAEVLNPSSVIVLPLTDIPALQHYRLVHESPTNVVRSNTIDVKYVKVFEYVEGAHIKGNGIIEVPVTTNTGRNFTYRQASVDGEFVVPYSTTGNPYDVKTTGKYHIIGTSLTYDVPESAVMQGLTIN